MKLTETISYDAKPAAVLAMLADEDFLRQVAEASGSTSTEVSVQRRDGGFTSTVQRSMPTSGLKLPIPVGDSLTIRQVQDWSDDGTGTLNVEVVGLPVTFAGALSLAEVDGATQETVDGELTAKVPFFGAKVEQAAAPAVSGGVRTEHRTGVAWLAAH